jgi:hypothetical protein
VSGFAWADYLEVAERLRIGLPTEADRRSSISRSHYAACHAAAAFVRDRGSLTTGQTHHRVSTALRNDPNPERADVGRRGNRLRLLRIEADYRTLYGGDLVHEADFAVIEAHAVIDAIFGLA